MFRVFSTVLKKSPHVKQVARRGVSSETSDAVKWEKEKFQMQLQHELTLKRLQLDENVTLKRLELDQKKGLERLGLSRETANVLTVVGSCTVVVSTGAWFVSQMLTHGQNFESLISGGNYPEQSSPEEPDSKK